MTFFFGIEKSIIPEPLFNSPFFPPVSMKGYWVIYIHQSLSGLSLMFGQFVCPGANTTES